jgi:glycerol-3-phosphate dehydrogenase
MARTIDDVLARRVRLLFLDARAAEASDKVANFCKELDMMRLGRNQIAQFKTLQTGFFNRI